ncbi:30S ribosomal protein S17e [Halostella sp. JP-L12]|uniref:30S ribosomal protein S17e n=1 Tax=Halostella TaxID=1843185 RepID=UPI000EF7A0C4|nr:MULTISPECIES: 30S ribosomal protein S17e [Halostella]NHN49111.1 30S ribosomal protein S17e [Halostella sp. JP-L12]
MTADPEDIISVGDRLLRQHPDSFSGQFSKNKQMVTKMTNVGSIRLRNRIAGYITRKKVGP